MYCLEAVFSSLKNRLYVPQWFAFHSFGTTHLNYSLCNVCSRWYIKVKHGRGSHLLNPAGCFSDHHVNIKLLLPPAQEVGSDSEATSF